MERRKGKEGSELSAQTLGQLPSLRIAFTELRQVAPEASTWEAPIGRKREFTKELSERMTEHRNCTEHRL